MSRKPVPESTTATTILAVVLQVRGGLLQTLLWQRAREPFAGAWALPGGGSRPARRSRPRSGASSPRRSTCATSRMSSSSEHGATRRRGRGREIATAYLGLVPSESTRAYPKTPAGIPSTRLPRPRSTTRAIVLAGVERLRASSPTRTSASLSRRRRSRSPSCERIYVAALGQPRCRRRNLKRVVLRRGALIPTGDRRSPGLQAVALPKSSVSRTTARDAPTRSRRSGRPVEALDGPAGPSDRADWGMVSKS